MSSPWPSFYSDWPSLVLAGVGFLIVTFVTFWTYAGLRRGTLLWIYLLVGVAGAVCLGSVGFWLWSNTGETDHHQVLRKWSPRVFLGALLAMVVLGGLRFALPPLLPPATVPRTSPGRLMTLLLLRCAALLVACLILVRPQWGYDFTEREPGVFIVLVDSSMSMRMKDEEPNQKGERQTRWQVAVGEWQSIEDLVKELKDNREAQIDVLPYRFDARLHDLPLPADPDGQHTGIWQAIEKVLQQHQGAEGAGKKLLGIAIVSDGRETIKKPSLDKITADLIRSGCPAHVIALGNTGGASRSMDVIVRSINAPQVARVKDRLVVSGVVHTQQLIGREVRVWLHVNGQPVPQADRPGEMIYVVLNPKRAQQTFPIEMPAYKLPDNAGDIRVALRVEPFAEEQDKSNNEADTYVTVTKGGLSVLYLDRLRPWEPRELARALKGDERITLYTDFNYRTTDLVSWRRELHKNIQVSNYDIFIIGDVPAAQLGSEIILTIAEKVDKEGKGLLMLGGHKSFADGDWNREPSFARLLPVDMSQSGQLEGEPGQEREIRFQPHPRALQEHHFLLRQGADVKTSEGVWKNLPALMGGSRMGRQRDTAEVLASTDEGGKGDVLFAVLDQVGKARTAALAVDTTWRWTRPPFEDNPDEPAKPGELTAGQRAHLRFWRNLILWLARQEDVSKSIRVELDHRRLLAGTSQGISFQAFEIEGGGTRDNRRPLRDVTFDYTIEHVDPLTKKRTPIVRPTSATTGGKDRARVAFEETHEAGDYEITVTARQGDKPLEDKVTARFSTFRDNRELLDQSADHLMLRKLAQQSGGSFHLHGGLKGVIEDLRKASKAPRPSGAYYPNWEESQPELQGLLFALFVALLAAEWLLRRMWGLV
jgi:hypothetical protein